MAHVSGETQGRSEHTARRLAGLRWQWTSALVVVTLMLLLTLWLWPDARAQAQSVSAGPLTATGTLVVRVTGDSAAAQDIDVPDAVVWLSDGRGPVGDKAFTGLDGKFRLVAPGPGTYRLCWQVQAHEACRGEVVLRDAEHRLGRILAYPKEPMVHGKVHLADGRACWVSDPFFDLDVSTTLTLNGAGGSAQGRANVRGQYVLIAPKPGAYDVTALCEGAKVAGSAMLGSTPSALDLRLPNSAPRFDEAVVLDGAGRAQTQAPPGSKVELRVQVKDRDSDPIEYLWRQLDEPGVQRSLTPTKTVSLPATAHGWTGYVMARDGRGGYAYRRLDLQVQPPSLTFSGTVLDEVTRVPVSDAGVTVGGVTVQTNAQGWFSTTVAVPPDGRSVLNIRHPNYALASHVFDRGQAGRTYTLIRADVRDHPLGQDLVLEDLASSGPCGSLPGRGGKDTPQAVVRPAGPVTQLNRDPWDVSGQEGPSVDTLLKAFRREGSCRHVGARLKIAADSLVTRAGGEPASGAIRASLATLDPTRRALPAGYEARRRDGREAELLSFGAVYASFTDASGEALNLKAGSHAELWVPVPAANVGAAQAKIPMWSLDEDTGRWVQEGQAKLVNDGGHWFYVGQTTHFSVINMDVALDPAQSTCVRFELGPTLSSWTGDITLRATASYGGTSVKTKEVLIDDRSAYQAVFRLPFGTSFPSNTLRVELFGTLSGQAVALVDDIIDLDHDARLNRPAGGLPPYPYAECGTPVTLNAPVGAMPAYATLDATGRPIFLTGPYGSFLPANAAQVAADYYARLDAVNGPRPTLGDWWAANGFGAADGSGGTRAAYLNHNDLGFGRDMHCRKSGARTACYVTNYGLPNQNPNNADAALAASPGTQGATVAMEHDPAQGDHAVQFYVYGNTGASATRLSFADLDGFGPKPVPHLCLVCHGGQAAGSPGAAEPRAIHARFREFDLPSFKYAGARSWNYGAATLSGSELAALGSLNALAKATVPVGSPIDSLIARWYPAGFGVAPVAGGQPVGWSGNASQVTGYHTVHATSCRTCHVARDAGNPVGGLTFERFSDFSATSSAVCGANRVMPNAVVTYKNFWADTPRVSAYEALTGVLAGHCRWDVP